ncbi:CBF/Mak21 family-domain-containing protein [Boletus reticuloceps]|uniref:CBF/Mak21 family-domain-containing protein n=1 Tax=Boletus reticuloceps TaxID=495285 RepID=A0A8I3ABD5_9AGAM|nr:CBF/Mak21 family-domain-containing protein [Boletus reticuloceps]
MPPSSLPPPTKRRKTEGKTVTKDLELQITAAVAENASLNPLSDLLHIAQNASYPRDMSKAVYSLYRVFVVIISSNKLAPGGGDAAKVVRKWVWERLDAYVNLLLGLLQDEEATLRIIALDILLSLLKHLSSFTKSNPDNQPQFHFSHFRHIVQGLLLCPPSTRHGSTASFAGQTAPDVRDHFVNTWFAVHDDIRWCFLRDATAILSKYSSVDHPNLPGNLLSIMEKLTTFPTGPSELNAWWVEELGKKPPKPKNGKADEVDGEDEELRDVENEDEQDDWKKFFDDDTNAKHTKKVVGVQGRTHQLTFHQSLHSLQAHRAVFTRTWLTFLPHLSSTSTGFNRILTTRALNIMHRGVLPHLTRPILVMDWISACVDLDYPSFYTRLYAFLDRDVLHLKHRARFFRLTELFLSSTHLPASLLASFVKRLSRLSLAAPPAAIIMIIPLTYNLLKRHPALMGMIHRTQDADGPFIDPFLPGETNPNITNAIDSSLWELYSHKQHYDSAVSTLVRIFEEAFTKQGYSMEDFLDHTYGTLIEAETKRRIRREPPLVMELVKDPFPHTSGEDVDIVVQGELDVVSELWVFG